MGDEETIFKFQQLTGRFPVFLAAAGLIYWAWHSSEKYAGRLEERKPGKVLAKHQVVPTANALKKEAKYVKKRLRKTTKRDRGDEKATETALEKALAIVEGDNYDNNKRAEAVRLVDEALQKSARVEERCAKLTRLDEGLQRYDWHWLKKTHAVDAGDLTPEQQDAVRASIADERKRIRVEEVLRKLEGNVAKHIEAMKEFIGRAKFSLANNNPAGATGWFVKAIEEDKNAEELESQILDWERRLLKLVKRQLRDLA